MAVKRVDTNENILNYGLRELALQTLDEEGNPTQDILILRDVKSFNIDVDEGDAKTVWTNDMLVFSQAGEGGANGTITVLRFPDEFLETALGQEKLKDGSFIDGSIKPNFNIFWTVKGDREEEIRAVRNVSFGKIQSQEYTTFEGSIEERNEVISFTVLGSVVEGDPEGRVQRFARYTKSKNPEIYDTIYVTGLEAPQLNTGEDI